MNRSQLNARHKAPIGEPRQVTQLYREATEPTYRAPRKHKAEHQLTISEQPLIVCWMCGDLREVEGNCPHCRAPKDQPDDWSGLTAKRAISIDAQKRQDKQTESIDKKPSKPVSKRPKKCEIYSSIFLRKTTKTAFRALRKVLPYSAQCHSDDELLSKLIEKGRAQA